MRRRLAALVLALMLIAGSAGAELNWPTPLTDGQTLLRAYIERVNEDLAALGEAPVNTLFECYSGFASLGVTAQPGAEVPEDVELIVTMSGAGLQLLTLRVSSIDRFAPLAAACIQAASPDTLALTDTMATPAAYAKRAQQEPGNSFADDVNPIQGDQVRTYYAYAPNEYKDGVNWLTLTVVFPWQGVQSSGIYVTPTPATDRDNQTEEYQSELMDDYTHFEVFITATPSPDDAMI